MNKKQQLKESIKVYSALVGLLDSDVYQNILKQYLHDMKQVSWIKPEDFASNEQFIHQYQYLRARAQVAGEIIEYIEKSRDTLSILTKNLSIIDEQQ